MRLSGLKIGKRLWLGFGITLVIMALVSIFIGMQLNATAKDTRLILDQNVSGLETALEVALNMQENGSRVSALFVTRDQTIRKGHYGVIDANKKNIRTLLEKLITLDSSSEKKALIDTATKSEIIFETAFVAAAEALELDDTEAAEAQMNSKVFPALLKATTDMKLIVDYEKKKMLGKGDEIKTNANFAVTVMVIAGLAAAISCGLFAFGITRSITVPLNEAIDAATRVAQGDLTGEIVSQTEDETGVLLDALSHMNANLVETIQQVYTSAQTISTAAGEIAAGNADLSVRTESQASSLEKTTSTMDELTSTVKQNADNAKQANSLALTASGVASKGGQVVGDVVDTMNSIKDSSKKIVDIIGVIDSIAFQTNILALNAAVEAARAGEQGRGFAVVASEVRNLAQRSASAAKEIKELINDSVNKVDTGTRLVDEAGKTMNEIVSSVKSVADIMAEITAASQEQSAGIEDVNTAINHIDEMTQQNAALVEQAAAAAESMQEQTKSLLDAVSVFKLKQTMKVNTQAATSHRATAKLPSARKPAKSAPKRVTASKTVAAESSSNQDWEEF